MLRTLTLSLSLVVLAACGSPADKATTEIEAKTAAFSVTDAYIREPFAGKTATAGYLTIESSAKEASSLVAVSSAAAEEVEIHTHVMQGGNMSMKRVDFLVIPSNGSLELRPMGDHLMVFDLDPELKAGDVVELELVITTAAGAETIRVDAPIRPLG